MKKNKEKQKWSQEEVTYIKSCFKDGRRLKTNRMIADRLGRTPAEVKNVVKRLRICLGQPNPVKALVPPDVDGINFMDLTATSCRAVVSGDNLPYKFCGKKTISGCSYCAEHKKRFHIPPSRRVNVGPTAFA